MSKITGEEIQKILPLKGPTFEEAKNYLEKYNDEYIVIKCGGSVLIDQNLFNNFINDISILNKLGFITMYSSLYFIKYFFTSSKEGPFEGNIFLISSSEFSNIKL